jgi:hypothetical protein
MASMRTGRKKTPKATRATPKSKRVIVCASLPESLCDRLDAFGEREHARVGLIPKRGTLAAMLIAKGLDAVEAGT